MKIKDIMNTKLDQPRGLKTIHCDEDISRIEESKVSDAEWYQVVDGQGHKLGEVSGELLLYLSTHLKRLQFTDIINKFDDGLVIIDTEGRICFENEAYSRILGVPMQKTIGKSMKIIEKDAVILKVLENQKPIKKEKQLIKSVQKYVSMRAYPLYFQGQFIGAYSVFRDVTQLNHLSKEVNRITKVAEEYSNQVTMEQALNQVRVNSSDSGYLQMVSKALIAAKTDATILIRGENGAGKEVLAKLIHNNSLRKDRPIITVNCAAIPENLIESELFGYEEGAFTGAKKGGKMGKVQLAEGGTLFLDEIGDMPLLMQTKLLRLLQDGEIEKIGRDQNIPVDVRIITATNQPLEKLIEQKKFRQDLYYRINVLSFFVPPLRERKTDIILLANHFLKKFNEKYTKEVRMDEDVYRRLEEYVWPGNVRELQNCIESAVIMCSDDVIRYVNIPLNGGESMARNEAPEAGNYRYLSLKEEVSRFEKRVIQDVLAQNDGDVSAALNQLGISLRSYYRKYREEKN